MEPWNTKEKEAVDHRRMHGLLRKICVALTLTVVVPACWAGRPLTTEDAGVLHQGNCEVETYVGRFNNPGATLQWGQGNCGIGHDTQLTAGAGRDHSIGRSTVFMLSGKTSLRELTEHQAGVTIGYTAIGFKQTGDRMRQEVSEIKGAVTVPYSNLFLHLNAGWQYAHSGDLHKTIWAAALERLNVIGPVDLMVETFGDSRSAPWGQVGARWNLIPNKLFLDAALGKQFNSHRSRQATAGLKIVF